MPTARPRLQRTPVDLPSFDGAPAALWTAVLDLADGIPSVPWTVVGGQMVFLHALEHGAPLPRISEDVDAAVDVRARPRAVREVVACLHALGFRPVGTSREGRTHRFERDQHGSSVVFDVLVPRGLGPRADTVTVPPGRAFPAPGVGQALARTELIPVRHRGRSGWVPRPSLLGAIVSKAAAAAVDRVDTARHLQDVAFLCGLVADPFAMADALGATDRRRLSAVARMLDDGHEAWRAAPTGQDATSALHVLTRRRR